MSTLREAVKGKVRKLLLDKNKEEEEEVVVSEEETEDEELSEQMIDRQFAQDVFDRGRGSYKISEHPKNDMILNYVALWGFLAGVLRAGEYNDLMRMAPSEAFANPQSNSAEDSVTRRKSRALFKLIQQKARVTDDGDIGGGTLDRLRELEADLGIGINASISPGLMAHQVVQQVAESDPSRVYNNKTLNLNHLFPEAYSYLTKDAPTEDPYVRSEYDYTPDAIPELDEIPDMVVKQAEQKLVDEIDTGIAAVVTGAVTAIGGAFVAFGDQLKKDLGVTGDSNIWRGFWNFLGGKKGGSRRKVTDFLAERPALFVVMTALAVGGAFGFRRYLSNRRYKKMARELARDRELMYELQSMANRSGLSTYKNDPAFIKHMRKQ